MPANLSNLITEDVLLELAGEKSYRRGLDYYQSGAVVSLTQRQGRIRAQVAGTTTYKVALFRQGSELMTNCDCPMGDRGYFCKHAVAAGLAWLAEQKGNKKTPSSNREGDVIRRYLEQSDPSRLVELLLEQAEWDGALHNRLYAQALQQQPQQDGKALKQLVQQAFAVRGFVDYRGMRAVLSRLYPVVDLLRDLLDSQQSLVAYELADYAMRRGLALYERVDDSDGGLGIVLQQISELHLAACRAAHPVGMKLATKLFQLQMKDHWGLINFYDYADLLDDNAMAVYRKAAQKEWSEIPAIGPEEANSFTLRGHYNITRIMEDLAQHDGDVDALVAIKRHDLSSGYHFLEVAELLDKAGRNEEALDWAERGLKAFSERRDGRLVEFVTAHYQRNGRHEDALNLAWQAFTDWPILAAYQHLKAVADIAGVAQAWRDKAFVWLEKDFPGRNKARCSHWEGQPGGNSLLVDILLWEGDRQAALAAARDGGCTKSHWFKLAEALEKAQPSDAATIYRTLIDRIVDLRNNDAYDRAAELTARIRRLMRKADEQSDFEQFLADLRKRHKAKRNFMQRLDGVIPPGMTGKRAWRGDKPV